MEEQKFDRHGLAYGQSPSPGSNGNRIIWRAVVLSWIAWLIGCGGMVVTRRSK